MRQEELESYMHQVRTCVPQEFPFADPSEELVCSSEVNASDELGFPNYAYALVRDPQLGIPLTFVDPIESSLGEIFTNIVHHAETQEAAVLRIVRANNPRRMSFILADAGVGFKTKVSKLKKQILSAEEAIAWAVGDGNSVRYLEANNSRPGGVGLQEVADAAVDCGGALLVISGDGMCFTNRNGTRRCQMKIPFKGSFVGFSVSFEAMNSAPYEQLFGPTGPMQEVK